MKFRKDTPIIYLSGFFAVNKVHPSGKKLSYIEALNYWRERSGVKYRCYSFPFVGENGFCYTKRMGEVFKNSLKAGDGIMMDSGAHSFHNFMRAATGKISKSRKMKMTDVESFRDATVDAYSEFLEKYGRKLDFYVNFDYTHDAEECYKMQQVFWKRGFDPIPVFHGEPSSLPYFERYMKDGAKLIGIGTGGINDRKKFEKKRVYFDLVFNKAEKYGVKLHGFAQTYLSIMFYYPWYSVDSASWAKCAAYGKVLFPDLKRNTLSMVHVSDHSLRRGASDTSYNALPHSLRREFERKLEDYGYDFKILRTSLLERSCFNASIYAQHVHELRDLVSQGRAKWKSLLY